MSTIKSVRFDNILPVIKEVLGTGSTLKLTVTGSSMLPFLREYSDSVELTTADIGSISTGDIVLTDNGGTYILHRVILKKKEVYYTAGDSRISIEGPFTEENLLAAVKGVWIGTRYILCSNIKWKSLSFIWIALFPARYVLIIAYKNIRRLKNYLRG